MGVSFRTWKNSSPYGSGRRGAGYLMVGVGPMLQSSENALLNMIWPELGIFFQVVLLLGEDSVVPIPRGSLFIVSVGVALR